MTDDKEKKDEKPKEDLEETLKGVLGWVQTKKETSKEKGKSWGWVVGLITAVLAFIGLAFAAWSAWKKGREIAKLKHKIDVDEEKKIQAGVDAAVADNDEKQNKLLEKANELEHKIDESKLAIIRLEEERKSIHKKIDKITSWEDVDELLKPKDWIV